MDLDKEIDEFVAERNKAFIEMDLNYARERCPKASVKHLEVALHKSRYECTGIPDKYRLASRDWLIKNAHTRKDGLDFLPGDNLPK